MKLFYWLSESEINHLGRRDGHYLYMHSFHFHIGDLHVMIGGFVFSSLYPFQSLRHFLFWKDYGSEYNLSIGLLHFFLPKVTDGYVCVCGHQSRKHNYGICSVGECGCEWLHREEDEVPQEEIEEA